MRLPNIFEEEMLCTITGGVEACAEDPDIKKNITSSFTNGTSAGMHPRGHYCTMHKTVTQRLQFVNTRFTNDSTRVAQPIFSQTEDKLRKTNVEYVQRTNADISKFPSVLFLFYRLYSLDVIF